jgi:hydroxyacylglutathione hydrolase
MLVRQIADPQLAQYAYLVGCQEAGEAILIDPERDVDRYVAAAAAEGLRIVAVAETHIHADFLSGARQFVYEYPDTRVYLSGEGGPTWTYEWPEHDRALVTYLRDGDTFTIGRIEFRAWHTPGHTPEHLSYLVTDAGAGVTAPMALVSGDFVFMGDLGRPDLLETAAGFAGTIEPSARDLYASARRFLQLPEYVQVWPGHGAGSACGKALGAVPSSTVGYERRFSPALQALDTGERAFTDFIVAGQQEPPPYFARMKELNKSGPPILLECRRPPRAHATRVRDLLAGDIQVVDTRRNRHAFFQVHFAGSFFVPLDRTFVTIAGAMLDPDRPILLVAEPHDVETATWQLRRIGFDGVTGWTPPEMLLHHAVHHRLASTMSVSVHDLQRVLARGGSVLDVRSASEFAAGHIPGAINVAHTRLRPDVGRIPADGPVYVHCATGARAAAAVAFLAHRGIDAVHVDGSLSEWKSGDVTRDAGRGAA